MGKLLVVGSVALDTVKTPFGEVSEVLGGSATFFSTAASYFTSVDLIAVVGEDFPQQHLTFLKSRGIDVTGLERKPGATFRWKGEYPHQLNEAHTLDTKLNVFETFRPKIPDANRSPDLLFLGNIDPELQLDVLQKLSRPPLVACDTMNFWINGKRDALWRVLERVDILIINDGEARALGEDTNLVKVAQKVLARGPKHLIIKRGEYGVLMFNEKQVFGAPNTCFSLNIRTPYSPRLMMRCLGPRASTFCATFTRFVSSPRARASPSLIIKISTCSKTRHNASRFPLIQKFIVSHATTGGRGSFCSTSN